MSASAEPTTQEMNPVATAVADEGRVLARYLLSTSEVSPAVIERYGAGCAILFDVPMGSEARVLSFLARRPWSLPYLDAAAGLIAPDSLLRKKLFLMLAILETLPENALAFTPRPASRTRVILRLARWGIVGGLKALAGMPLLFLARRSA